MKTVSENGALILLEGKLMQVNGYYTGEKILCLEYVREEDKPKCPCCEAILQRQTVHIAEGCANFQGGAEAVQTLEDK